MIPVIAMAVSGVTTVSFVTGVVLTLLPVPARVVAMMLMTDVALVAGMVMVGVHVCLS